MEDRMTHTARFAIARFVPDLVRGDGYNIGVVLQSNDGEWIAAKFDPLAEKVADLWPDTNRTVIRSYIDGIKRTVASLPTQDRLGAHHAFTSILPNDAGFLPYLARSVANIIQVVDVREIRVTKSLTEELDRLYDRYVGRQEKPKSADLKPIARIVRDALRNADLVKPDALQVVRDPVLGKHDRHPIQFVGYNGVPHAIHSHDLTGPRAPETANEWRGRYLDMAATGSTIQGVRLHMFVKIPEGLAESQYAPTAILDDEPGINVYTSVQQGVTALSEVFADH